MTLYYLENRTLLIQDDESLSVLSAPRGQRNFDRIALRLPDLDAATQQLLERRLNKHYLACGCEMGAIAVAVYLVLVFFWRILLSNSLFSWTPGEVGIAVLFLFLAALLGKIGGLLYSKVVSRRIIKRLLIRNIGN